MGMTSEFQQAAPGGLVSSSRGPALCISDEQGNKLTLDAAVGGNGALLQIVSPDGGAGVMFWLKADRIEVLVGVLKSLCGDSDGA